MSKLLVVLMAIILAVVIIILGPFITIWAWNQLFGAAITIPYTIETWLSVIILGAFLRAKVSVKRS